MEPDASQWDGLIGLGIVLLVVGVCILPRVVIEIIVRWGGGEDGDRSD